MNNEDPSKHPFEIPPRADKFERKLRRDHEREPDYSRFCHRTRHDTELLSAEFEGLIERARLTPRQLEVVRWKAGLPGSPDDLGLARQTISIIWGQALLKLVLAWRSSPYYGLQQVYREETRRDS